MTRPRRGCSMLGGGGRRPGRGAREAGRVSGTSSKPRHWSRWSSDDEVGALDNDPRRAAISSGGRQRRRHPPVAPVAGGGRDAAFSVRGWHGLQRAPGRGRAPRAARSSAHSASSSLRAWRARRGGAEQLVRTLTSASPPLREPGRSAR